MRSPREVLVEVLLWLALAALALTAVSGAVNAHVMREHRLQHDELVRRACTCPEASK